MVVVRVVERCDTWQVSYNDQTVVRSMRRPPQPTPWWCNGRARASLGSGCTLSEVAFEGLETRLFGRRAGVRASGRIYGTVRLYISRHIYDLTTCLRRPGPHWVRIGSLSYPDRLSERSNSGPPSDAHHKTPCVSYQRCSEEQTTETCGNSASPHTNMTLVTRSLLERHKSD
mgnify:CR=1 FL=1